MKAEDYFRGKTLYLDLFTQARKTYHSYGRLAGSFKIDQFSEEEKHQLGLFLSMTDFELGQKKRMKWSLFERAYGQSKFAEESLIGAMTRTLRLPFHTKIEEAAHAASREQEFLKQLETLPNLRFLVQAQEIKPLFGWYIEEKLPCMKGLRQIDHALGNLPTQLTRLPFFAHRITGDPHAFDPSTRTGKILIDVLQKKRGSLPAERFQSQTEFYTDVLLNFNLVRDDIMNFVAVNGLLAKKKGIVHPLWQAAVDTRVSWNVPVRHLLEVNEVMPSRGGEVYLVENSGVYSALLDAVPTLPLVCTNGQLRLATWLLLDKLVASGTVFHYSGDFDPEGLQMADQLLQRYPVQLHLWCMTAADYIESNPKQPISAQRLLKLKNIRSPQLREIAAQMAVAKRAGYQEAISRELLKKFNEQIRDSGCK
ncbi:MAG: DUF2399 domain-containing protein [Sporolactobacillus sp.]